jgi:signal transduction histidine kinase
VGELRFRNFRTQRPIPVGCNVFLLCDEVGRPARFATVTRDLTEQKKTEEYLRHQDRMKDEFLATVSHELRTPLNAIVGWTHILRAAETEAEMREKGVEVIARSARALSQLVSDLLDVSRIIAGKLALEVQALSVLSVLEEALDMVRPAAQAKDITLTLTVRSEPPDFSGDPDRLQQVVWNLLSNAIKFVPRGGHIHVGLQASGPDVEITIEDDGPGINPDVLPYIFERFRQEDSPNTRRLGGLGLGLAIVRHLVELHGGTVDAANRREPPGAVFTVTLPRPGTSASRCG